MRKKAAGRAPWVHVAARPGVQASERGRSPTKAARAASHVAVRQTLQRKSLRAFHISTAVAHPTRAARFTSI